MLPGGLLPPGHAISFSDGPSHALCSGACLCFSAGSHRSFSPRSKHRFLCCVLILTSGARTTCSTEPVLVTSQAGNILCHVLSHVIPTTSSEGIIVISISKMRKWRLRHLLRCSKALGLYEAKFHKPQCYCKTRWLFFSYLVK